MVFCISGSMYGSGNCCILILIYGFVSGPATFLFTIHYCILSMGAEYLTQQAQQSTSSPTSRYTTEQPPPPPDPQKDSAHHQRQVVRSDSPLEREEAHWKVFPPQDSQEELVILCVCGYIVYMYVCV